MKVLLVKPYNLTDHIQPSLGLGYLATALRKDHDVRILDCIKERVTIDKLSKRIKDYAPDVLGLQCYTFDLKFVKEALQIAKAINKEIVTVVGGPHPSAAAEETFSIFGPCLDYLFAGEAEGGFPKLLDAINKGYKNFEDIPGLSWREDGQLKQNIRTFSNDLDSLGLPAWDLIRPQDYPESQHGAFFQNFPIAPIMVTRGCPYPCTFCAGGVVSGKKVRKRSAESVLGELELLNKEFGIREFHIIDDNFTMDVPYAKDLLRKLKARNLGMSWAVPNGVRMEALDRELLGLMRETGLYLISLGIESGSDHVLKLMKKGTTTAKIRERIKLIRSCGIDIAGFFILGFPGETAETVNETIRFAKELDLVRANFFTYLPFPGSESYEELKRNNKLEGVDWKRFYFMNAAYVPDGFTRKGLKALHRKAFASFFLRPRIIMYNLKSIKSFRHMYFLARRFFNWIIRG